MIETTSTGLEPRAETEATPSNNSDAGSCATCDAPADGIDARDRLPTCADCAGLVADGGQVQQGETATFHRAVCRGCFNNDEAASHDHWASTDPHTNEKFAQIKAETHDRIRHQSAEHATVQTFEARVIGDESPMPHPDDVPAVAGGEDDE